MNNPAEEIDAEFYEPEPIQPQDYFSRLLQFINQIENDWRNTGNHYLAEKAGELAEAMRIYREENNQFIPKPRPIKE